MYSRLAVIATLASSCDAVFLQTNASSSQFMLVAGVSSAEENCLLETTGYIGLDSCSKAVAAGDGREIWSLSSSGQLMNVASKKCVSAAGHSLAMSDCGSGSAWKLLPNGQVQVGDACLSQSGEGAGTENIAVHAAAEATSSADFSSHAAAAAVDADDATFWASSFGEVGPVSLTIDFGEARRVDFMKIAWEFPALSYSVFAMTEGNHWTEAFAMSGNVVKTSRIPLGLTASKIRVDMKDPSPSHGTFSNKPAYGIKSVVLLSPRLQASLGDCAVVLQSTDAREKYFAVSVADFDPAASSAVRTELPALAAAIASLRGALGEVVALPPCDGGASMIMTSSNSTLKSRVATSPEGGISNFDESDVNNLLAEARSMILKTRAALN